MPQAVAYVAAQVATWVSGAVYSGLTAIGVSAANAALISTYAASLAAAATYVTAYAAPALLAPRPGPPSVEAGKEPINQTRPPRRFGAGGRQRLSGPRLLFASIPGWGLDVIALAEGPVVAGATRDWLNDDEVTTDGAGVVQPLAEGRYGGGNVWIGGTIGRATETAMSAITAVAGDLWTSAHRGDGVATMGLKFRKVGDNDLMKYYPLGRPKGSRLVTFAFYDWRKDTTAGGSGAHRRDDPTTWEACRNPVVCLVHNEVFRFGQSWDRAFAPILAELTIEANYCDETVERADGGFEPRYAIDGSFMSTDDRANVRRWYLESMDGSFWRRGDGAILIRPGRYVAPTFRIPARHVTQIAWKRGVQKARRVNQLTGTYVSPDHNWTEQQADPWRDEASITAVGVVSAPFDRTWVASHDQWRRLAKREKMRRDVGATGSITTNLWGLNWQGQRYIVLEPVPGAPTSLQGDTELEVVGVRKRWPLQVVFDVILSTGAAIDAFDPVAEGGVAPGAVPRPQSAATPIPEIASTSVEFVGDQAFVRVTIDTYPLGLSGVQFSARFRPTLPGQADDVNWTAGSVVTGVEGASSVLLSLPSLAPDADYDVSVMAISSGVSSAWSMPPLEVSTAAPAAPVPPPSDLSLTGGVGAVTVNWREPAVLPSYEIIRHNTTNTMVGATALPNITPIAPSYLRSQVLSGLPAGSRYVFITAYDAANIPSATISAGPVTVT